MKRQKWLMGVLAVMLLASLVLAVAAFVTPRPALADGGVQPDGCVPECDSWCLCCAPVPGWQCCSEGHCCSWPNCLWREDCIDSFCNVTTSYYCQHH